MSIHIYTYYTIYIHFSCLACGPGFLPSVIKNWYVHTQIKQTDGCSYEVSTGIEFHQNKEKTNKPADKTHSRNTNRGRNPEKERKNREFKRRKKNTTTIAIASRVNSDPEDIS